jgi:thiol-disulfide isomerase/thioredoxin
MARGSLNAYLSFRLDLACCLACCVACGLALSSIAKASEFTEYQIGQRLPDAALQGINGPSRHLRDFRGKPLLINVWASWCGPCKQEMASLERLAWSELAQHINIIGISTDDYPQQAKQWLAQSHSTISHFIDERLQLEHMLGASRLPLTVLVGPDGRILSKIYGAREWDSPQALALLRAQFAL